MFCHQSPDTGVLTFHDHSWPLGMHPEARIGAASVEKRACRQGRCHRCEHLVRSTRFAVHAPRIVLTSMRRKCAAIFGKNCLPDDAQWHQRYARAVLLLVVLTCGTCTQGVRHGDPARFAAQGTWGEPGNYVFNGESPAAKAATHEKRERCVCRMHALAARHATSLGVILAIQRSSGYRSTRSVGPAARAARTWTNGSGGACSAARERPGHC